MPYYTRRPSPKELTSKLRDLKSAVTDGRLVFLDPVVIAGDAMEAGCTVEEIPAILAGMLDSVTPKDYAGGRPPDRSYKDEIRGCELYPFTGRCDELGCVLYIKFALRNGVVYLVSFHKDR